MKNAISADVKKKLLKMQQAELDAVPMYKSLSELVKEPKLKETFLLLAKDEGKHAAIIKKLTGEVLMPKTTNTKVIGFMYRIFGLKAVLKMISKGEFLAAEKYITWVEKFPELEEVRLDEFRHGEIAQKCLNEL